jgi:hypothetical protein
MTHMTSNSNARTAHPTDEPADTQRVDDVADHDVTRRRTAGAWTAGGALWATAGLLYANSGWQFRASSATFLAADILLAAGTIGLLEMRPHGVSRPATAALIVALAARVVFAIAEVSGLLTGTDNTVLLPIAGLLTGLSTIAYGALAGLAERRLRAASIAMGLYFFVVMMPLAVTTGEPPAFALAAWGLPAALIALTLTPSTTPHRLRRRA